MTRRAKAVNPQTQTAMQEQNKIQEVTMKTWHFAFGWLYLWKEKNNDYGKDITLFSLLYFNKGENIWLFITVQSLFLLNCHVWFSALGPFLERSHRSAAWSWFRDAVISVSLLLCWRCFGWIGNRKQRRERLPRENPRRQRTPTIFRREGEINKAHAGTNVKSRCGRSLIIFTRHRKGHGSAASMGCWQELFGTRFGIIRADFSIWFILLLITTQSQSHKERDINGEQIRDIFSSFTSFLHKPNIQYWHEEMLAQVIFGRSSSDTETGRKKKCGYSKKLFKSPPRENRVSRTGSK